MAGKPHEWWITDALVVTYDKEHEAFCFSIYTQEAEVIDIATSDLLAALARIMKEAK